MHAKRVLEVAASTRAKHDLESRFVALFFSSCIYFNETVAFEFDSSCRALWGALQLESNSNASFRRLFEFKILKQPKIARMARNLTIWTKSIASARTKFWKIFEWTSKRTNAWIVQKKFEFSVRFRFVFGGKPERTTRIIVRVFLNKEIF